MGKKDVKPKPKKKKSKGAKLKGNKKDKPRKHMSAYMVFCKERRPKMKLAYPKMAFADIGRKLGREWSSLSEADKYTYNKLSLEDRERYFRELAAMDLDKGESTRDNVTQKTSKARNMNGYQYFCKAHTMEMKARHPHLGMCDVRRLLGKKWSEASKNIRRPFEMQADADRRSLFVK